MVRGVSNICDAIRIRVSDHLAMPLHDHCAIFSDVSFIA